MTNQVVNGELHVLARAMATQANRDVRPRVNVFYSTMTARLRDF